MAKTKTISRFQSPTKTNLTKKCTRIIKKKIDFKISSDKALNYLLLIESLISIVEQQLQYLTIK